MRSRKRVILALAVGAMIATIASVTAVVAGSGSSSRGVVVDDGGELLKDANISLDQAIDAAEDAYSGALGEVDLETYQGRLVFNIDIGDKDVKVDAANGDVLGFVSDDDGDDDDDDDDDDHDDEDDDD